MRKALAALILLLATPAHADEGGDLGIGVQVGGPTGLNGKYYMDQIALQFGVGLVERGWDDGTHAHLDVLWHPLVLARERSFTMPLYFGVGGRILEDDNGDWYHCHGGTCYDDFDDDLHVGVRVPVGLLMAFHNVPIDAFLELAPVVDIIHDDDADYFCHDGHCHEDWDDDDRISLYVTLGARYYF
ncbi:MAG TPA: hypothetical protein VKZ63_04445 [Kofleriaceae bacterium]|nr:hypothetical protein [Kofleriaceae bacterium]